MERGSIATASATTQSHVSEVATIYNGTGHSAQIRRQPNECGIVCAGLGIDDHGYLLDDVSSVMAPNEWAMTSIALLRERRGDCIIAESNNGGDMVENTLRMVDPNVPYHSVWASQGKVTRAEPISTLYEQGRVHHVGAFPHLEDQMCAFTVDIELREMNADSQNGRLRNIWNRDDGHQIVKVALIRKSPCCDNERKLKFAS